MQEPQKGHRLAHREGRTRNLQIEVEVQLSTRHKSLTLYPIELGGQLRTNRIWVITRPCSALRTGILGGGAVTERKRVKAVRRTFGETNHVALIRRWDESQFNFRSICGDLRC